MPQKKSPSFRQRKPVKNSPQPSSKLRKTAENLKKMLLQFIGGKRYQPMTEEELSLRLQIPLSQQELFSEIINELSESEVIRYSQKNIELSRPDEELITGTLRLHPKGFGFVIPDNPALCPQDVFIPKHLTDSAVDGDLVEVAINTEAVSEKGPEGKINSVLKRARHHLGGTIRLISSSEEALLHSPLLGTTKKVVAKIPSDLSLKLGDRVIVKVIQWGSEKEPTLCEISHLLGNILDPAIDVVAAAEEFDLRTKFSKKAVAEAKKYGKKVSPNQLKKRKDFSKKTSITIDPDTAKDFDDALHVSRDRKGNYLLIVHIADVAHYVPANTSLDVEAAERANSTYFPGTCIPMLPEELSNELCSLKPKVIRLTVSVSMKFDPKGNLLKYEIDRAFIKSAKRFTYFEAKDVLDGKKRSVHARSLERMVELCHLLKAQREKRGSIDFALPELAILVDEKGKPTGMKKIEYDITHQLVEEFMLKANEIVALELSRRGKGLLYRVHESPQEENFKEFLSLARTLGFQVPAEPSSFDLQHLFQQAKKTPFFTQLSIAFIRSMKLAQYSPDNIGHFGLALEHYCHFTSPIRRYSDLVIQRLLFDEEPKEIDLEQIAKNCSDQERISFRAEMSVKTLKKLRLLEQSFDEDPTKTFSALVTKVKPFGISFELQEIPFEGFLHVSELTNDFFIFDEKLSLLRGRRTGVIYQPGMSISVRLQRIDLILLEAHWELQFSKKSRTLS